MMSVKSEIWPILRSEHEQTALDVFAQIQDVHTYVSRGFDHVLDQGFTQPMLTNE